MDLAPLVLDCPPPFVNPANYPPNGGYIPGRFCGALSPTLSCCLPCPIERWVYSDAFISRIRTAYWFNLPALLGQVFLLLTFAVLPTEQCHGHYLSVGLVVSMVLLELAFIVPLGTKPHSCFNEITPNDMHSDLSFLLRSIWTNLRVCWDVHHTSRNIWLAHVFGWGIPALFLTISLSVTGVSYRLGTTCIPNPKGAIETWFGWLIGFACAGALIQLATSGFCLFVYTRNLLRHESQAATTQTSVSGSSGVAPTIGKRLAWRRVKKVMLIQWRSIVLSVLVLVQAAYFGTIYVALTRIQAENQQSGRSDEAEAWSTCIVLNGGDKEKCLQYSHALGMSENTVVASLFMASLIGVFTFALMVRWSMLVGWYELLREPRSIRFNKRYSGQKFVAARKRISGRSQKSVPPENERFRYFEKPETLEQPTFVLPDPEAILGRMSVPETGDVSKRHETNNLFEQEEEDEENVLPRRKGKGRRIQDDESGLV